MGFPRNIAVAGAALLFFIVAACGEKDTQATPNREQLPTKTIDQVLDEHANSLMALSGVVGVGEGECSGKPCIKVLVVKKTPGLLGRIPSAIEGYTVDITETGEIKALDNSQSSIRVYASEPCRRRELERGVLAGPGDTGNGTIPPGFTKVSFVRHAGGPPQVIVERGPGNNNGKGFSSGEGHWPDLGWGDAVQLVH